MADRVLITGARAAAALDLARDFAAAGYEVHMADSTPARLARCSRAVRRVHAYPSPVRDPAGFAARMGSLVETLAPVLVVPSCEEVFHLARLGLGPRLFQPPAATLRQLHDKGLFADLCGRIGLRVPGTHAVDGPADLEPLLTQPRSWVLKARYSRFGEATLVGPPPEVLRSLAPTPGRWIAQRRVFGREVSFYAVAREGRISAFVAYDSRWRLAGGACLTFDPLEAALAAPLLALAATLAAETGLDGQFGCDVMIDEAGRPWLLECNPRATSGVHLLTGGGRLARAMTAPEGSLPPVGGSHQLLPALLTLGLGPAIRAGRLGEWRTQLGSAQDVAGRPGDRAPALGALLDGLGFMISGLRSGTSTAAAMTADIEWNGEELR